MYSIDSSEYTYTQKSRAEEELSVRKSELILWMPGSKKRASWFRLDGPMPFSVEQFNGSTGSTPFPRTVLKRRKTSNPERRLYAASWDYGTAQCSRRYHCVPHPESGSFDGEYVHAEHSEEPLTGCVITTVANSTHTTDQAVLVQTALEVSTGKLSSAIRMHYHWR